MNGKSEIKYFVRRDIKELWRIKSDKVKLDKLSYYERSKGVWSNYFTITSRLEKIKRAKFEKISEQEIVFFL